MQQHSLHCLCPPLPCNTLTYQHLRSSLAMAVLLQCCCRFVVPVQNGLPLAHCPQHCKNIYNSEIRISYALKNVSSYESWVCFFWPMVNSKIRGDAMKVLVSVYTAYGTGEWWAGWGGVGTGKRVDQAWEGSIQWQQCPPNPSPFPGPDCLHGSIQTCTSYRADVAPS